MRSPARPRARTARPHPGAALTAAALGLLLLAGCTQDAAAPTAEDPVASSAAPAEGEALPLPPLPAESAFAEGTCRLLAPDVLAVGQQLPLLGPGGEVPQEVEDALRETQVRLTAAAETSEPQYAPALAGLVQSIGIVRIRAVGKSYEPGQGQDLRTSYDALLDVCT